MERLLHPLAAGFAASLSTNSTIRSILTGTTRSAPNGAGDCPLSTPKLDRTCCYAAAAPIRWQNPHVLGTTIPGTAIPGTAIPGTAAAAVPPLRMHTPLRPGRPAPS